MAAQIIELGAYRANREKDVGVTVDYILAQGEWIDVEKARKSIELVIDMLIELKSLSTNGLRILLMTAHPDDRERLEEIIRNAS